MQQAHFFFLTSHIIIEVPSSTEGRKIKNIASKNILPLFLFTCVGCDNKEKVNGNFLLTTLQNTKYAKVLNYFTPNL
ncbi:MAG: hypothetical protein KatS3mg028_0421 [Bacteroidia bacterium]|nr:MAG: hypothetical protein KatS3mg028_0421 [Bacteroidia bacterium]